MNPSPLPKITNSAWSYDEDQDKYYAEISSCDAKDPWGVLLPPMNEAYNVREDGEIVAVEFTIQAYGRRIKLFLFND